MSNAITGISPRERTLQVLGKIVLVLVMSLITLLILYPLFFVLATSFKSYSEFLKNPFGISFHHLENYAKAWIDGNFSRYFINSLLVSATAVVCAVFASALVSYSIGVLHFKGSKVILMIMLSTMFFTGEITSIPNFLLLKELHLLNSLGALLFGAVLAPAGLGALLGVNYVRKIPGELREAAMLDGAGLFQIFLRIDFRLMLPILSLVAIQTFTAYWSDFFWPLITITTNDSAKTLTLGLINFQSQNSSEYGVLAAGLVILTAPIVLLYTFLSKYFIEGVAAGAVKG